MPSLQDEREKNEIRNGKKILSRLKEELNQREKTFLSKRATFSQNAIREN